MGNGRNMCGQMITTLDFKQYYETRKSLLDQHLDHLIPKTSLYHQTLFEAARYSLLASAKRLRPLIAIAVAESYGIPPKSCLNAASALELIHTYSLIHDDLPCMDNDDFRRGRPTLHRVFNESHALLTGDYLLTKAFEVIAQDPYLTSDKKINLIQILSEHSGGHGMIGGQVMDLDAEDQQIPLTLLEVIHQKKTAGLIIASIEFGACIADAPFEDRQLLMGFGNEIGLAFQIIDDILDETGTLEEMGKKPHSDEQNKKSTFATLLGIEAAREKSLEHLELAKSYLDGLSSDHEILTHFADFFVNRRM